MRSAHKLTAPLWLGAALAVLALVTLLPDLRQSRRPPLAAAPSGVPEHRTERA
ncbi:hypothetical protein JNUCC64_06805 [Streptomyces sp. JNUCC 64]